MTKLTKRQNEILALIRSHVESTGSPPTRAEIAKTMGFRSPNAAEDHLRALARKGVIELVPGTSRGIRLAKQSGGIPIVVVKTYSPHKPILLEENIQSTCRLERTFFSPPIDYLLQVTGGELKGHDLKMEKGDYLAVHQTQTALEGQVVVLQGDRGVIVQRYSAELHHQKPTIEGVIVGFIRALP